MSNSDLKTQVDNMLSRVWGPSSARVAKGVEPSPSSTPVHLSPEVRERIEKEAAVIRQRVYGDSVSET